MAIALSLYDQANGAGVLLGGATSSTTAVIGQVFSAQIVLNPVLGSVANPVVTYGNGIPFHPYYSGSATISFGTLYDPDGNVIPSSVTTFYNPVTVTSSDSHVTPSATWSGPAQPISLRYDASTAVASTVTISLHAASSAATVTLNVGQYTVSTIAGSPAGLGIAYDAADPFEFIAGINGPTIFFSDSQTTGTIDYPGLYFDSICVDGSGSLYVASATTIKIYKRPPGTDSLTTLAGSGASGSADGSAANASFNQPLGLAVDGSGNVYVADQGNEKIRKITPAGVVSTLAGSGASGSADGPALSASFNTPDALAVDSSGNVFVADENNNAIRKITPSGSVSTLASILSPTGLTVDSAGILYVVNPRQLFLITPSGSVKTLAGSPTTQGTTDGIGTAATFDFASGVMTDSNGLLYVSEYVGGIRVITP